VQHDLSYGQLEARAYVCLRDELLRGQITLALERAGFTVLVQPTGYHLLQAIAEVLDGSRTSSRPALIVVDAIARGCAGTTIALGLRDLGLTIPTVLVTAPHQGIPFAPDEHGVYVVGAADAERAISKLANAMSGTVAGMDEACNRTSKQTRTDCGSRVNVSVIANVDVAAQLGGIRADRPGNLNLAGGTGRCWSDAVYVCVYVDVYRWISIQAILFSSRTSSHAAA